MAFWHKTRHFGKITAFKAFDENHGFRDFRVSVIIYWRYLSSGLRKSATATTARCRAYKSSIKILP